MANFTIATFSNAVIDWANNRAGSFKNNWVVKGGWEGWIQVDLVSYILSQDSSYDILREQPIYLNTRKKTDLLLNANMMDPDDQIPVEIKAQSWENRGNIVNGVEADLDKLDEERADDYDSSSCVMLAIVFEETSYNAILRIRRNDHAIFNSIYNDTEVAILMAAWTSDNGWLNP